MTFEVQWYDVAMILSIDPANDRRKILEIRDCFWKTSLN